MERVGPIPEWWIRRYFGTAALTGHNNSGLRWPPKYKRVTPWMKRCSRPGEAWAAWALWVALRQLRLDSPTLLADCPISLRGDHGIGAINNVTIGFSKSKRIDASLRLGNRMGGWLTPGPTTAEEAAEVGYHLSSAEWIDDGSMSFEDEDVDPYDAGPSGMAAILNIEVRRAVGWIDANPVLGMTCLLGPLPRRAFTEAASMRKRGELNDFGGLTKMGWWRLASTANLGVGKAEAYRARKLVPDTRTWYHMRQIQLFALREWREHGWVPIGVEYSELGWELRRLAHRYRPDAMMVTPAGELVWFEYMRRRRSRLSAASAFKYIDLKRNYLPFLARTLHRPIRFVYEGPDVNENYVIDIPHIEI